MEKNIDSNPFLSAGARLPCGVSLALLRQRRTVGTTSHTNMPRPHFSQGRGSFHSSTYFSSSYDARWPSLEERRECHNPKIYYCLCSQECMHVCLLFLLSAARLTSGRRSLPTCTY